jgi:hypothetical protein
MTAADGRVPGYLGRVLDSGGEPVATCFQVALGVLVTAWHVLDDLGMAAEDAGVWVDPLGGGDRFAATVARLDPVHDLAVLTYATGLARTAGALTATDQIELRAAVSVTGHCVFDDDRTARFLNAPGEWAGGTTWDDAVPVGRMTSTAVLPGMSGAPVVRDVDGAVAGVVSGRYNTADGWLTGTVWVARTEDLAVLLDGVADVELAEAACSAPVDLVLEVTGERVRLTGAGWMCRRPMAGCVQAWPRQCTRRGGPEPGRACRCERKHRPRSRARSCRWPGRRGCWVSRSCLARSRTPWGRCWQPLNGDISRCGWD